MTAAQNSNHEKVQWRAKVRIDKYEADLDPYVQNLGRRFGERTFFAENAPYETIEVEGNLLMTAGANALWTALSGGSVGAFSNANAAIGVGDSTTASAASQTNLQATTNAARVGMSSGYPAVTNNQIQFQATFGGSIANFSWNEWGVFNSIGTGSPPAGGVMLNRAVPSGGLGVKASGSTWTLTVTLSLS